MSSGGSIFGTPTPAKPVQNIFGGGNVTSTAAPSLFGGTSPQSQNSFGASPFGSANTATSTTNLFGGSAVTSSKWIVCFT